MQVHLVILAPLEGARAGVRASARVRTGVTARVALLRRGRSALHWPFALRRVSARRRALRSRRRSRGFPWWGRTNGRGRTCRRGRTRSALHAGLGSLPWRFNHSRIRVPLEGPRPRIAPIVIIGSLPVRRGRYGWTGLPGLPRFHGPGHGWSRRSGTGFALEDPCSRGRAACFLPQGAVLAHVGSLQDRRRSRRYGSHRRPLLRTSLERSGTSIKAVFARFGCLGTTRDGRPLDRLPGSRGHRCRRYPLPRLATFE